MAVNRKALPGVRRYITAWSTGVFVMIVPNQTKPIVATIFGLLLLGVAAAEVGPPLAGCPIKGNVSLRTGERIYHAPGQKYYYATRINWVRGERWFCSESAARAAGWRRSKV